MKAIRLIIILSVTINALLAGWWLKSRNNSARDTSGLTDATTTSARTPAGMKGSSTDESAAVGTAPIGTAESQIGPITTWLDIQSADLKQFVRRLRDAGCPDETVKDIILAEVNRRFTARAQELWPENYESKPFWKVDTNSRNNVEQQKKNRERMHKQQALQKEKSALLVELLGVDPEKQQRIEDGYDEFYFNWQERRISFLPESKRESVLQLLDEFQDKQQEMYAANAGIHDAQSRAEQKQLETEKLAALSKILSPSELREYELREFAISRQTGRNTSLSELSREEFEALFDINKKYGDSIHSWGDLTKEERKITESNKEAMKAEMTAALGEPKVKEMERASDYQYQQLQRLAKKNDLPSETAGKVYDYKSTAEDTVKKLRDNKDLTNEQRQTMLQQIRTETETTLKQTLGDKAYKSYMNNGGWWINNIAPQQRPATVITK